MIRNPSLRGNTTVRGIVIILVLVIGGAYLYVRLQQGSAAEANNEAISLMNQEDYHGALQRLDEAIKKPAAGNASLQPRPGPDATRPLPRSPRIAGQGS